MHSRPPGYHVRVYGPNGVGKTAAIHTAFAHTAGVVYVNLRHSEAIKQDRVKELISHAVTRMNVPSWCDPFVTLASCRRVAWWHRLLFRRPITVVLACPGREDKEYAGLGATCREFTTLGLTAVIDAATPIPSSRSSNAGCEKSLYMDFMCREELTKLPQLKDILDILAALGLQDTVWGVLGGAPRAWEVLVSEVGQHFG